MDSLKIATDKFSQVVKSEYFTGTILVVMILFSSLIRAPLPASIVKIFDYPVTKMVIYLLIVLLLTQNLQVAIVVSIAFYVMMNVISEQKIREGFINEYFSVSTDG